MPKSKSIRSPLARARNSGANGHGAIHWIRQRSTAILMIPLLGWLLAVIPCLVTKEYGEVVAWFQSPCNAAGMALFVLACLWHAALGLQVVVEDYVHCKCAKPVMLLGIYSGCAFLAIASIFAILKISIGS